MNKTMVWVGVLVIVVILVIVLVGREGAKKERIRDTEIVTDTGQVVSRGAYDVVKYDDLVKMLAGATGLAKPAVLDGYMGYTLTGSGVVTLAEADDQGWYLEIDLDPEAGDGPEVFLQLEPDRVKKMEGKLPAVGQEIEFKGRISGGKGDETNLTLDLIRGWVK